MISYPEGSVCRHCDQLKPLSGEAVNGILPEPAMAENTCLPPKLGCACPLVSRPGFTAFCLRTRQQRYH